MQSWIAVIVGTLIGIPIPIVPLSSNSTSNSTVTPIGIDKATKRISDSVGYLGPLDTVFYSSGLILLVIGIMAFSMNKKYSRRRDWGFRLASLGVLFTLIGANIGWFLSLIKYVIP